MRLAQATRYGTAIAVALLAIPAWIPRLAGACESTVLEGMFAEGRRSITITPDLTCMSSAFSDCRGSRWGQWLLSPLFFRVARISQRARR